MTENHKPTDRLATLISTAFGPMPSPLRLAGLELWNRHALEPFETIAEIEPYILAIRDALDAGS